MNEDLKYQEYLSNGGALPYEEYISAATLFSQIESADEDLKKKVNPTENGTPSLTTGTPPSQTDLPTLTNPIPENEFMVPLGSEQDLSSPSLGITAEMLSTDLPSTATVSSGVENSNVTLPTVTQPALSNVGNTILSTIQKPKTPLDVLAGKSNDTQVDTAILSNPTEINADASENNFEANQVKIDAQKSSNDFIDQYKNKDYVDAEKKFAVQPFDTYGLSDNNQQDIVELEKSGVVEIQRDESGNPILEGNQYRYKYVDKNYYDNTYVPYIDKLQREYKSQAQEQNIDSARFNFGNAGNEPEQDGFGEFVGKASKFGVLPTTEEYENLTTTEQRNEYLATAEATQNAQKNRTTFQEEYDKVIPKYALTEQVKIANGFEALNLLNGGLESGSTKDKSESDFFNNYFTDKNNVLQFGEYWSNEGKAKYQSSQVMENQANYQAHRAEIWNDYLSYQNNKLGTDMRFIEEAITNSSTLADKYALSGDMVSAQKEIDKVNNLSAQYNANEEGRTKISNLYSESNKNFTQLQKQKKQEEDLQIRVENGDVLSNVGNILGQIPLGIATSVTSTITGAGRIISSVIPSDNLKDALDIISTTDLKVGNVKVASLSNKIVDFIGSDGSKYREINGRTYGIKSDGKLFATKYNRGQNDKVEKESVDYNWGSGLAFVSSKMMTDIVLTSAVGGGINKGLASASSRIANSKNIAIVFGEGSQLAKSAESFARLAKNADNVSVSGWYVQMYNDSYQMAERGGIKGELNKSLYAITQSFMQSVIQRINPDINFLKSMNDESRQIVRALMTNEKDKAVQLISAFVKKTGNNVLKETGEELVQQVTQDINNIVINKIGKTNLETTDSQGYKEVVFGTVIPSAIASLMGGKGSRIANINNKEIDLTTYSRNDLVTELARDKNGIDLIKDFRNTAYFQSQKDFAQDIANEITERQKYISKVPEVDKYSTSALSEVTPILQKINKKKEDLKKDDGTFAERINKDIAELTTQANAILDNDLTPNNESPNAETAQPTPQSEAVQEQTTETEQPQVATQSEQPTITGEQNVPSELNPKNNGQTAPEIQSTTAEAEENVQPSNQGAQDTANQLPEMGQGIAQSENATQEVASEEEVKPIRQLGTGDNVYFESEKHRLNESQFRDKPYILNIGDRDSVFPRANIEFSDLNEAKFVAEKVDKDFPNGMPDAILVDKYIDQIKQEYQNQTTQSQEEINEDDIVLADDTLDLINSITDETAPSDNIGTDGSVGFTPNVIQQGGQENNPAPTIEPTTSQGTVEVKSFPTKNGKYTINKNGNSFELIDNKTGKPAKVSDKTKDGYFLEIAKSQEYPTTEIPQGVENEIDYNAIILSESKNPKEVANVLLTIPKYQNVEGSRDAFIANNINRVSRKSFLRFSDENNITIGLAKAYFAKSGEETNETKIDNIAKNASFQMSGGEDGTLITPQEVIDFILENRKGAQSYFKKLNPDFQSAVNKFIELTGVNPNLKNLNSLLGNTYNEEAELRAKQQAEKRYDEITNESRNKLANEYDEYFNSLTLEEQQLELQKTYPNEAITNETEIQSKPSNTEGKGSANVANKVSESPEYKSLIEQRDSAEKEVASKKAKLDSVSKSTNQNFQADQENLFGERATTDANALFDERANGNAGQEVIATAKREYDQARAELTRINNAIRDFENGNASGTGAIDFQSTDKTFTPIPQSTYDKLVKRLLGVFKKFGGNVVTDLSEFKAKAKELGFSEIELQNIEYRMDHTAPVGSDGFAVPISDLSGLYPDDVYSNKASLYYGDGLDFDAESASILQSLKDKPNKLVTVYRAVPDLNKDLNKDLKKLNDVLYELENDRIPNRNEIVRKFEKEEFYTDKKYFGAEGHKLKARELSDIIREEIRVLNESKSNPIKINSGDWVTINKKYAILHGQSNLDGKYKIVQKKLKASQVFTDANSLHEQGVEFMKTANGEIYGAKLPDGTIYLNPEKVNANTPIHEFSHLWQQLMPTRFKKGVELLKNTPIGKKTFAELKANEGYANKSDEELWNEALVTVMGNEGERIFNSPRTSKLKEWLTDLFKSLGNAFGIRDLSPNDKLSTFVKGALSEVMGTKEIIPESSVEQKEVPIYIKKMSNTDLRGMLDKLGLVMDAVCPN